MKVMMFVLLLLLGGGTALAAADKEGFEPVNGDMMARGESVPAPRLVAGAYGFIFGALLLYVATVVLRTRRLEEEMQELKRRIEKKSV